MPEQVRLKELLQNPVFAAWHAKEPPPDSIVHQTKRWVVWVQVDRDGPWAKREFKTWRKGHKWLMKKVAENVWDGALVDKVRQHEPQLMKRKIRDVKGKPKLHKLTRQPMYERFWWPFHTYFEDHEWCGNCRRPTVFKYYTKHHALPGRRVVGYEERCKTCGVRKVFLRDFYYRWTKRPEDE